MSVRVLEGDVLAVLPTLEPESVHMVCTSPPYYGLRDYGTALWDGGDAACDHIEKEVSWSTPLEREQKKRGGQGIAYRSLCGQCGATRVDSQLGLEATPEQYVQTMVAVFREVRRVLRRDGTLWLNIGDSYAGSGKGPSNGITAAASQIGPSARNPAQFANGQAPTAWIPIPKGLKSKDLIGIPWALAKAMRDPYYAGRIKAERDRTWLAALIDGEGCISGYHHTRRDDGSQRTGLNITLTNSSTRLLDEADRIWPGVRVLHNRHGGGHLGLRDTYRWLVHGVENEMLLMREMYPYLIAKKSQALVAYNLLVLMADAKQLGHSPRRDEVRDKRSRLVHVLSALNQDKPTDIPSWCVVPPSVLEEGWYLRADVIWSKPNPMPESVTDRPTKAHEYLFLLTKSARYFYDADAIREDYSPNTESFNRMKEGFTERRTQDVLATHTGQKLGRATEPHGGLYKNGGAAMNAAGRNKRSVWEIATQPYAEAHFATFPTDLVEPCIKAGTSEHGCCPECGAPWVRVVERTMYKPTRLTPGQQALVDNGHHGKGGHLNAAGWRNEPPATSLTTGWRPSCTHTGDPVPATVLDPFSGAGTTLLVADRLNRHGIGIELNPTYAAMARQRITGDNPLFTEVAAVELPPAVPVRWDATTHTLKDSTPPTVLDGQLALFLEEGAA